MVITIMAAMTKKTKVVRISTVAAYRPLMINGDRNMARPSRTPRAANKAPVRRNEEKGRFGIITAYIIFRI